MVNIGTLSAFVLVSFGIPDPPAARQDLPRGFQVPWSPVLPIVFRECVPVADVAAHDVTWLRFLVWLAVGIAIYLLYGRRRSRLVGEQVSEVELPTPQGAPPPA